MSHFDLLGVGEDHHSRFLESFPTYRLHSKPRPFLDGPWVFSRKDERYENNSYSLDDDASTRTMIYEKIISAFSKIDYDYQTIVQFWAPVTSGGKHLLSTSGQPFAVSYFGSSVEKYRRLCEEEYGYDIDVNNNNNSDFRGTPASAFLNRIPEMASTNPNAYYEVDRLLRYGFRECWLKTSFMIPICCPYHNSSSSDCIGVMECSSSCLARVHLFNEMIMKIMEVGLGVYNVQDRIPYKTITGLKPARDQIQEALEIVCQSHQIALAQVWIAPLDENHMHFSSSWEEAQSRRLLGLKLTGYNSIDDNSPRYCRIFQSYYDACDWIPLQPGAEFVMKTLQDYEPRFCKNISKLGTNELMLWDWSAAADGSMGLTICMRSIHTGDFNYVFEFLWKHNSFYPTLLEELLLKIKRCLPSFKFASGTEIGDRLRVIEVDMYTDKEIKKFDIFQLKRLSPIPEAMNKGKKAMVVNYNPLFMEKRDTKEIELSREDIEQHYGKTMKKAAEELGVSLSTLKRKHNKLGMSRWQGPDLPQRKAYKSNKNQSKESHSHEKDNGVIQDPSPVKRNENTVIKAEYADDIIKLHLRVSEATFVTVENEIGKKFKLKHGTFKIKYLDEDEEWILMTSDQDLSDCIQNLRRLRVLLHNQ